MHRYIIVSLKMHNIQKIPKDYSLGIFQTVDKVSTVFNFIQICNII